MSDAAYDLGPSVPTDGVRYVHAGTSLLITGPPDVDKREVALEFLAAGQRRADGVIVVSVDLGARPLVAAYESAGGTDDQRLRIIDATGFGTDDDRVAAVDSPTDLASIGSAFGRQIEQYVTMGTDGLRVGHLSATAMLERMDRGAVYKFLRTMMDRVDRGGYLGVSTIDTATCNEQTVAMLADAFDALVELRPTRDGPEFRVSGLNADLSWTSLTM
jgi:KaiC/GvpD/RAD55 family RecA-like ATPase